MCAQARRRFTQVIHMVMHSKADNTFSCRAGRQRVSVPVLARGGRPQDADLAWAIAHDGGHRMLAAYPAGRRPRLPRRLPAVTLIMIVPQLRFVLDTLKLPGLSRRRRWSSPACATTATSRSGRRRSPSTTGFSS